MTKFTAEDLNARLATRYAKGGWAYFPQMRDATGAAHRSTADGIAIGLWPSRGYEIHGFEIKVTRGDWLHDLDTPQKNDAIVEASDYWWIVAAPGVVQTKELPTDWGLLCPHGERLKAQVRATNRSKGDVPRSFMVALICRLLKPTGDETDQEKALQTADLNGFHRGVEYADKRRGKEVRRLTADNNWHRERARKFAEESGIDLTAWDLGNVGAAVRLIRKPADITPLVGKYTRLHAGLEREAEHVKSGMDRLTQLQGATT